MSGFTPKILTFTAHRQLLFSPLSPLVSDKKFMPRAIFTGGSKIPPRAANVKITLPFIFDGVTVTASHDSWSHMTQTKISPSDVSIKS